MGFFLPGFLGPVILLGNFLGTGLKIVHGGGILLSCGLFLQFGVGAFLGLLGGKLVLGFLLCFFILGLVIRFFLVLPFLRLFTLIQGLVLFQLGFDQADDKLFLRQVVPFQIGFHTLKQTVRHLEGQGSHTFHILILLCDLNFGMQLVVHSLGNEFSHGHAVGLDVGFHFGV